MKPLHGPSPPVGKVEAYAYRTELRHCFIVRMTDEMRDAVELHRCWLSRHYKRDSVSLAEASRDLFARSLMQSEPERKARVAFYKRRQLDLFSVDELSANRPTRATG